MISRSPKSLIQLLRRREGTNAQIATLGGGAAVTAGDRQGNTDNIPDDPNELLYDVDATPDPGDALTFGDDLAHPTYTPQYATIEIVLDQAGTLITNTQKMDIPIDFACTVVGWSMFCSPAATARIDLWKDIYANFPPVVGDSMCGVDANKPKVVAATKATGTPTGSSWTTAAITAGDIIRVNLDTNDLAIHITLSLKVRKI